MARFKDSEPSVDVLEPEALAAAQGQGDEPGPDRAVGVILAEMCGLDAGQVAQVLSHQREVGCRFGESAVALGMASRDDVLRSLAQQFRYPYAPDEPGQVGSELVVLREPFSPRAEAFRALRSQILMRVYAAADRPALAVVSPDGGDGRTFTAANLAVSLAQVGAGRTLLVDADLRSPRQHQVFGLSSRAGLSGILSGRSDARVIEQVPGVAGLFVLPAGPTPPNPLELVERSAFVLLMHELTRKFDHVVVDTPAAAQGTDASVIASRCGAALVLARRHRSRAGAMRDLVGTFEGGPVRMAGVVINEY